MREAHSIEQAVGMTYYVSDAAGIGGRLKATPGDFRVTELEAMDLEPVSADPSVYPHLVVRVELVDWETNGFASALSNALGISRERVSWAGTKDKRAVTTQLMSVDGVAPEALPELSDSTIEVVGRAGRPVLFGDLAGNAFEITLRDVAEDADPTPITAALAEFAGLGTAEPTDADNPMTVGVPNYFGQQRFGSRRAVTHEVGLAILRDDWEAAVLAYVGNPSETEPEATRAARRYVAETRDWQGAGERFPAAMGYERAICQRLAEADAETPASYRRALEALPTNLQTLCINAAQAVLFNRMVSERLARDLPFDRPVAGDVVCFSDADAPADLSLPDVSRTQQVDADRVATVERHCERGRAFVTAPLVGTETTLSDGEQGEIEREVLAQAGISQSDFDLPGEFHSTGTRRAILLRTGMTISAPEPTTQRFSFALPKGSYATVLLREYQKTDPMARSRDAASENAS
jgi:tRNA pseudouridine13 synthase